MKRQEFIHLFGFGAAMVLTGCLGSCTSKSGDSASGPSNVDFTLDLADPANARLNDPAFGYVYGADGEVIVAKTTAGGYVALAAACTHQGTTVQFESGSNGFVCPNHGSRFTTGGVVLNGPAAAPLRAYTVVQTGTKLRVTSQAGRAA